MPNIPRTGGAPCRDGDHGYAAAGPDAWHGARRALVRGARAAKLRPRCGARGAWAWKEDLALGSQLEREKDCVL
eukprot:1740375-Pleurochrysis_carterae.AAC.1